MDSRMIDLSKHRYESRWSEGIVGFDAMPE